ncbi:hypothetical protein Ntsu_63510 [Nocardia sp. IFM 10818]
MSGVTEAEVTAVSLACPEATAHSRSTCGNAAGAGPAARAPHDSRSAGYTDMNDRPSSLP